MSVGQYLDREGRVIDKAHWEELQDNREYVRIGATEMRAGRNPETLIRVSTVWTGVNTGSHEIFETLVMRDNNQIDSARYQQESAARQGHNEMVGKHLFASDLRGPKLVREIPEDEA
ncbi:hypothetical protein ACFW2V_13245 [Streptomyces sp. NPDC058947]|uniref:hypothetical protein n=1 Tax=Streptomyces sp. NPDC058947 TaxID=3346675 RepID=UPI00368583D2